jgi:hypothetical protein
MSDITAEELLRIVHRYYPVGFPPQEDTSSHEPPPYQRTPEFCRWQDVWEKAIQETRPWHKVFPGLKSLFPNHQPDSLTPAYHSSCFVCSIRWRTHLPDGQENRRIVRVAGAMSLLAPVYLVYGTVELDVLNPSERRRMSRRATRELAQPGTWEQRYTRFQDALPPRPQLFLAPTEEMQPHADTLARHIEHTLGYRRFPLELADVRVPDIRVHYLNLEEPTLLNALFMPSLESI